MKHSDLYIAIQIAVTIVVAWVVWRLVRRLIKRTIQGLQTNAAQKGLRLLRKGTPRALLNTSENVSLRRAQRAETIGALFKNVAGIIILVIAALSIIGSLSVNLGPFVAGTAVATAALGFGAQNIVRDFLAGFFIVVEDQYGVGDVITLDANTSGTVEEVSLRITRLRDSNGTLWAVPNGEIKKVGNKSQNWSQTVSEFRVNYGADIATVVHVMKDAVDDMWHDSAYAGIITAEPVIWGPEAIDGEGMLFRVAVKVRPLEQWRIGRTVRSRVKAALDQAGIRIASALPDSYAEGLPE